MLDKVHRAQNIHQFNGHGVSLFVNMNIKIAQHNDCIIVLKDNSSEKSVKKVGQCFGGLYRVKASTGG
jgi:large exoprotein involved in heme utilization and adhesion